MIFLVTSITLAVLFVIASAAAYFRDLGYRQGFKDGVTEESQWWLRRDKEVEEGQKQVWRYEARWKEWP